VKDAFALFGFERRPLINEVALKEKYLRLAAARHPDLSRGNDEQFHLLQDAYKTLRDPAARLRHLMGLEFPGVKGQDDSTPHAELFMRAGNAVHAAKAALARSENTTTAVARALLSADIAAALKQLREAITFLQDARNEIMARLERLDARWPDASAAELAALASSFTFISRWMAELSECEFRLANQ
jgi:curved DNA-binding protein CbpA